MQKYSQAWKSIEDLTKQFGKVTPKQLTADTISEELWKKALNIKSGDHYQIFPFVMSFNVTGEPIYGVEFCR